MGRGSKLEDIGLMLWDRNLKHNQNNNMGPRVRLGVLAVGCHKSDKRRVVRRILGPALVEKLIKSEQGMLGLYWMEKWRRFGLGRLKLEFCDLPR